MLVLLLTVEISLVYDLTFFYVDMLYISKYEFCFVFKPPKYYSISEKLGALFSVLSLSHLFPKPASEQ